MHEGLVCSDPSGGRFAPALRKGFELIWINHLLTGERALTGLLIGSVLPPVVQNWREQPKDGFPLYYYQMFSLKRSDRITVRYLVGLDVRGSVTCSPARTPGRGYSDGKKRRW